MSTGSGLPLFDLFAKLRAADFRLGPDDYRDFLEALRGGFGLPDRAALARLAAALWVKSRAEQVVFDALFAEVFAVERSADTSGPTSEERIKPHDPDRRPAESGAPDSSLSSPSTESAQADAAMGLAGLPPGVTAAELVRGRLLRAVDYYPVTRRQMKQGWRRLRRMARRGPATQPDLEETLRRTAADGFLLDVARRPPRCNVAGLLLFLDRGGSMVPFHDLGAVLAETAVEGRLRQVRTYYFSNGPRTHVYLDPEMTRSRSLSEVLTARNAEDASVLVFSDAGAARGSYARERVRETVAFLDQLGRRHRRVAWLNPMPRERWSGTSAGSIALRVPMFPFDRAAWRDVIAALRGRQGRGG